MDVNRKKVFVYSCILISLSFIISLRPMILSTYTSSNGNSVLLYLGTFLPMAVLFLIASRYIEHSLPSLCCTLATILTLGNASAMPLLRYTSAYEVSNVLKYSKSLCLNSLTTVLLVPTVWFILWLCNLVYAEPKRHKWICGGYLGISGVLALAIFFLTDKNSGTTIIHLPGVSLQAALPVMIVSIFGISLAWHIQKRSMRIAALVAVGVINIVLFLRGETGIPLITLLSFCLWYYLLQPTRYSLVTVLLPIILGCGATGVIVIHMFASVLPSTGLLHTLLTKIEGRIFSGSVDQVERALRNIRTGGFWGSSSYNINVPEASSDFCLATILHYSGLIFLILMLAAAIPMFYSGAKYYTNKKHELCTDIGSVSMAVLFTMLFYNILMCCSYLPVLGSQLPFTGVSITYSILSAFLLGTITYSNGMVCDFIDKLKGGLERAQC